MSVTLQQPYFYPFAPIDRVPETRDCVRNSIDTTWGGLSSRYCFASGGGTRGVIEVSSTNASIHIIPKKVSILQIEVYNLFHTVHVHVDTATTHCFGVVIRL